MIIDVWSRKLIGWEIHTKESMNISSEMFKRLARKLKLKGVNLHSDSTEENILPNYFFISFPATTC